MDLGVAPAHDLDRADVFVDEAAANLDAVTAEIDDRATAGKLFVSAPIAMGTGVSFAGTDPEDFAEHAVAYGVEGLERLGSITEVFEVAVEDAGLFAGLEHPEGLVALLRPSGLVTRTALPAEAAARTAAIPIPAQSESA
jgi:hypothetical protein